MNKKIIGIGLAFVVLGFVLESIKFAFAKTKAELKATAVSFGIPDALIVLGLLLVIATFFIKK